MAGELRRRDPVFDDIGVMRRWFDRMAGWPALMREGDDLGEGGVAVDIYEQDDKLVIKAAMPGVRAEDIQVNVADGVLTMSAEAKKEENVQDENYHRREFRYGRIARSFRLPANVDPAQVGARYENGVLQVVVPRKEEAQPRRIEVKAG